MIRSRTRRDHARLSEDDELLTALGLRLLVDKLRRGILLIDCDRRVRYRNPAADQIMNDGAEVLRMVDGRLEIGSATVQDRFERYVEEIQRRAAGSPALALRVDRADGTRSHRTLVSRLDRVHGPTIRELLLSVIVYEARGVRRMPLAVLTELYGMTRAEAGIVAELYAGRTLADASQAVGIKTNTARTHLKRIFDKCEVRSQAELLQLLALGPKIL